MTEMRHIKKNLCLRTLIFKHDKSTTTASIIILLLLSTMPTIMQYEKFKRRTPNPMHYCFNSSGFHARTFELNSILESLQLLNIHLKPVIKKSVQHEIHKNHANIDH